MNTGEKIINAMYEYSGKEWSTAQIAKRINKHPNTARKWLYRLEHDNRVTWRIKFYGRGIYLMLWSVPLDDIPF